MENRFKIGKYYINVYSTGVDDRALKCIDQEGDIYFFKRVEGKYSTIRCDGYKMSSRLCKRCTRETVCSKAGDLRYRSFKEVPKLKALLLYEK